MVIVLAIIFLTMMAVFDLRSLKATTGVQTWAAYISLTTLGFVVIGVYLTWFDAPSLLTYIQSWLQPMSGWLAV